MSEAAFIDLKPATRQNLSDSITDSLRDAIFGGLFRPGQRLAEAQLASSLKVSRAPVREALSFLEQEGLVRRSPSGGTTVSHLSRSDVDEICTLRTPLEVLAMRLAVVNRTEKVLAELTANLKATERVSDPQQLAQLDLEFHEIVVRAAGHSRLLSSWLNLRSQIRLIMTQRNQSDSTSREGTVHGHLELFEAIQAHDADRAAALLEFHLNAQHQWFITSFTDIDVLDSEST
ncbi:MAG TPA: GntR family transcriptional regulator [Pirellulales bacterium]|jgi:DNA-binding GntR family transcriptional regulator|nr:GntR family transcriptional regulator [Pirellulales bacterium]